jgi:peptide/nickel transport system substrate-binding protein
MMTRVRALALVLVGIVLVSGCSAARKSTTDRDQTLRVGSSGGPFVRAYNPLLTGAVNSAGYSSQLIYEPLLQEDFANGNTVPWLAKSYQWSRDGKQLTIDVRNGVTWSDGQPFTAADVAFTFGLLKKYAALNTIDLPLAGAVTQGTDVAVIKFSEPAFQDMWWRTTVVPKHLWQSVKNPVTYGNPDPVGTGPYRLKSFSSQVITMQRNTTYWQTGKPSIGTVQYVAYDSTSSMISSLEAGDVDWVGATGVDASGVAKLAGNAIGYWNTPATPAAVIVVPNTTIYPLSESVVRRAMSMALGRDDISKIGTGGQNLPITSPTGLDPRTRSNLIAPPYKSVTYPAADPDGAKSLLESSGYKLGSDGVFVSPKGGRLNFKFLLPTTSPFGDMVRAGRVMTDQWRKAGISVSIATEQPSAWRDDSQLGNFQLTMRPNGGTPAVYDFYNRIFSQSQIAPIGKSTQRNYERYVNPAAGTLLKSYSQSPLGSQSELAALGGLQSLMVNDAPVIPVMFTAGLGMWRTGRFTGFPDANNPYAVPLPSGVNSEIVMMTVKPRS